jgi:hypothetical protein
MSKQLMEVVLPRLARRLYDDLQRFQSGELSEAQFNKKFAALLHRQYRWLARRGVSEVRAALAIHAGVLVLSYPGLRAEALELGVPLEVVERQAVQTAAADVAANYDVSEQYAAARIAAVVARYSE